jgi:hypothetical protein
MLQRTIKAVSRPGEQSGVWLSVSSRSWLALVSRSTPKTTCARTSTRRCQWTTGWFGVHEPLRLGAPALRYLVSEGVIRSVTRTRPSNAQEVRAVSVCAALGTSGQREVAGGMRLAVMKFNSWTFTLCLLCLLCLLW